MSDATTKTESATEPAQGEETSAQHAPARRSGGVLRRLLRGSLRVLLLAVGPLVIITVGGFYYATSGRTVTTENAYVKVDHVLISPDVDGRVVKVYVRENEVVSVDHPLFRIDPWRYKLRVDELDAQLAAAESQVAIYRAAYRQAKAELEVEAKNVSYLEKEYQRRQDLARQNILAKAELDDFHHKWQLSQRRIVAIREKMSQTLANLGGDPDLSAERHPRYKELLAKRNQAALDLERTMVRSPAQGVVSNVDLQLGEYVEEGKPVFSLMSTSGTWVEANLKETQLTHVVPGQPVTLRVDAYPDHEFTAHVSSLSPGTGAEFSLLPPQNATGNWVKVVQRVPVRIELDIDRSGPRLRAGMSVEVEIETGYERPLPGFIASALALVGYD